LKNCNIVTDLFMHLIDITIAPQDLRTILSVYYY